MSGMKWRSADYGAIVDENDNAVALHVRKEHAPLIAAAPDMLEALKGAHTWLSGWASAEPYIGTIEAALKKAEQP